MEIESQFRTAIRGAVNRRSRKPFYWGGLKGYQQLKAISQALHSMQTTKSSYFRRLTRQVDRTLERNRTVAEELEKAHTWFRRIAACLRYPPSSFEAENLTRQQVALEMQDLLREFALDAQGQVVPMALYGGLKHRWGLIGNDLLHCYDIPGLPPDNLQMESLFGRLRRRQRRISGRKSTKALRDFGHCQVLFMAQRQEQLLVQLRSVPISDYQLLRKRIALAEAPRQFLHRLHRDPVKTMSLLANSYTKRQSELSFRSRSHPNLLHTD